MKSIFSNLKLQPMHVTTLIFLFCIAISLSCILSSTAQESISKLIRGENGKTASFIRLSSQQQIAFSPGQVKELLGLDEKD